LETPATRAGMATGSSSHITRIAQPPPVVN